MLDLVIFGLTHNILSEVREHKMDGHSSPYLRGRRHHHISGAGGITISQGQEAPCVAFEFSGDGFEGEHNSKFKI